MTDPKTLPVTFSIQSREFVDTLTTALTFALRDSTLPMLDGVDLNIFKGQLVTTATDRFRLALIRSEIDELDGADGRLGFLDYATARKLIALMKPAGRGRGMTLAPLTVTVADGRLTVDNRLEKVTVAISTVVTPPDVIKLITESIAREAKSSRDWAVNPKLLASFARASSGEMAAVRVNDPTRPLIVSIGDNFIGLLMPVRMGDPEAGHDKALASWSEFFTPPKPARKRAPRKAAPRKAAPAKAAAPKKRAPAKKAAKA
ncbi:hypothetical protein [Rhodococcus sp. MALMAid1271]|uniref:DNA polymerase III subunit beta family protein n=1 Tax=Rhodococcus sp. MALMAid1271 TaxID=3411744 RepID=UPI003BA11264